MVIYYCISSAMPSLSTTNMAEQAIMMNLMMAANNPFFNHGFLSGFPSVPFPGMNLHYEYLTGYQLWQTVTQQIIYVLIVSLETDLH